MYKRSGKLGFMVSVSMASRLSRVLGLGLGTGMGLGFRVEIGVGQ